MTGEYDAIVLAGGRASRLAGAAKPQLQVGDQTMLERVLAAVGAAGTRIVVGPAQAMPAGVEQVQEQPAGGGPVAALAAGLARVSAPIVVVLAADLPFVTAELIATLVAGLYDRADHDQAGRDQNDRDQDDVALLVDEHGRGQYLLSAWRTNPLRDALAQLEPLPGTAMKALVRALRVRRIEVAEPFEGPAPWTDVDTPADLEQTRDWLRRPAP